MKNIIKLIFKIIFKTIFYFMMIIILIIFSLFVLHFIYDIFDPVITFNITYRNTYYKANKIIKKVERFYKEYNRYPYNLEEINEKNDGIVRYNFHNIEGIMFYVIGFDTIIGTSKGYAYNSKDKKWSRKVD